MLTLLSAKELLDQSWIYNVACIRSSTDKELVHTQLGLLPSQPLSPLQKSPSPL